MDIQRIIGAHCSIAEGFLGAAKHALHIGARTIQMFSSNPHQWGRSEENNDDISAFVEYVSSHKITPLYFHASYLINLADSGRIGKSSATTLVSELSLAPKLGVKGSVVHVGSWKGETADYDRIAGVVQDILKRTPEETLFIMENSGMRKIGASLEDISELARRVQSKRFKVCLDTCHLFTSEYDIRRKDVLDNLFDEFDKTVGMEHLELFHLNDSRDPFGSYRDRHENIGEGSLGLETFRALINHPSVRKIPFILEVPGFDGDGPDKKNVDILKSLVS